MRVSRRNWFLAVLAVSLLVPGYMVSVADEASANTFEQGLVVDDDPVNNTPNVLNGHVTSITTVGNRIIVGGTFTQVRAVGNATIIPRNYIFAYDRNTGAIDNGFIPVLNGPVEAIESAGDGTSVFVGGSFSTVNGTSNFGVTKLNVTNGAKVAGFTASTAGKVRDLGVHGNTVYLGGDIWSVNGVPRNRLAAINATTGAVDSTFTVGTTAPRVSVDWVAKLDVSPDGTEMVIIGNFLAVDGQARKQIARIDLSGAQAQVMDWSTEGFAPTCASVFWTYMRDVEYSLDSDFFVVATTGAPFVGTLCDTASRWESEHTGAGVTEKWADWSGGDTLTAVAISDTAVYIGGHQRWMNNHLGRDTAQPGAVSREGIAALDIVNGVPLSWNPGKDRGVAVWDLHLSDLGLYVGSDTDFTAGEYHPRLAQFPLTGGTSVPLAVPDTLPTTMYTGESGTTLTQRSFDGSSFGTDSTVAGNPVNWSSVGDAFIEAGKLYYVESGILRSRTFDGSAFGSAVTLPSWTSWTNLTAAGWNDGRMYYVDSNSSSLRYRYLSLESGLVGSQTFTLTNGISWTGIAGIDFAGGRMYYAKTDGNLWVVDLANGNPVNGTQQLVSGPATGDGKNWADAALFFLSNDGAPTVTLTSPTDGSVLDGSVTLAADAADAEGIDQVEFFVDGASVGVDDDPTGGWTLNWNSATADDGPATVSATATDTAGKTVSDGVGVTIDNLGPTVSITSPSDGASVSGVVGVSADATDVVGVADVEFFVGGSSIGVDDNGGDGWSVPWDTAGFDGSTSVSATATDTFGRTSTDSIDVTVDNSGGANVVFVVGSPGSLNAGETAVRDRLQSLGYTVTVIDDNGATAGDAQGSALVVLSSTINSATGATFRDVAQPVWVAKPYALDDMGLTGPAPGVDYGTVSASSVAIVTADHPMAGGFDGNVGVTSGNRSMSFGVPGPGATVIASAAGQATTFVYQPGAALVGGGTAAGCRLTSSIYQGVPTSFTSNGWELFEAAAVYAVSNCDGEGPPPGDQPPTVTITDPTAGSSVSGSIEVTADAEDDLGVTQVEFFADGVSIGTDTDGSDGWTATWDSTTVPDGSHALTATATDTIDQTASDEVAVAVTNTSAGVVLMVVSEGSNPVAHDVVVRDRLIDFGYAVTVVDDGAVTPADAAGTSFVLVASSSSSAIGTSLNGVTQPIWMAKPFLFDDLGMTGAPTSQYGTVQSMTLSIVDDAHPMAAGFSGDVALVTGQRSISWGIPAATADVVATVGTDPSVFAYPSGSVLANGSTAAGCRLTFPLFQTAVNAYTADAWSMVEATAAFAAGNCS